MTQSDTTTRTAERAGTHDQTALVYGLLAYLGGGASAVYIPLGVIGVPVALLFGTLAIRRAGERQQWVPVGLSVLGGIATLLWFALMALESGLFQDTLCPAACLD